MFGIIYGIGRVVHGVTDVLIEVDPPHVAFYVAHWDLLLLANHDSATACPRPRCCFTLPSRRSNQCLNWGQRTGEKHPRCGTAPDVAWRGAGVTRSPNAH